MMGFEMVAPEFKKKLAEQKAQQNQETNQKKFDEERLQALKDLGVRSKEQELEFQKLLRQQMHNKRTNQSDDIKTYAIETESDDLIDDYMKFMKDLGQEDIPRPEPDENGRTTLSFPTEKSAVDFFNKAAESNRKFIVVDAETNKVICYSNGDGNLYQPDGQKYASDNKMIASDVDINDFRMPESPRPSPTG